MVLRVLTPLAVALLVSGLDDLVIDVAWAAAWIKSKLRPAPSLFPPGPRQLESAPRLSIAILVPLWKEDAVIARMLSHNVSAIHYTDYHFFAGTYPNDDLTQAAVRSVADQFPNVHLVLCPHDGPTSKADCLNWIYQHVGLWEEQSGRRFDVLVTHDAEDLIHPDELLWINFYAARYDFVQTPVLALPTPLQAITHGVYCDEFAEYHTRDMPVRPILGGFLPGAGVGTAYRRDALEKLAMASSNRIFEPEALTEDYENGLRLFRLGCSQAFVPLARCAGRHNFVATREYFPQTWRSALRQRTRWVMGIALQEWQWHGWGKNFGEMYWLWRDRKGLIANPLSVAANFVFLYGIATEMWLRVGPVAARISIMTLALQLLRIAVRVGCSARIYGPLFALGVPVRAFYANLLNSSATIFAIGRYAIARMQRRPLKWLKTEHAYPSRAALVPHTRKLGQILVSSGALAASTLQTALASKPVPMRLGDHLINLGLLDAETVYGALSLQQGLSIAEVEPSDLPPHVARVLPEAVMKQWHVLPFQVAEGTLFIVSPEIPSPEMSAGLRPFTGLEIRFHLTTPAKFESLRQAMVKSRS